MSQLFRYIQNYLHNLYFATINRLLLAFNLHPYFDDGHHQLDQFLAGPKITDSEDYDPSHDTSHLDHYDRQNERTNACCGLH